jgi:hypothetical protein
MGFMKNLIEKKVRQERKHRTQFAEYLQNRIRTHQARLDNEEFEDEDDAVHLTQHVQRLRMIIDELNAANGGTRCSTTA